MEEQREQEKKARDERRMQVLDLIKGGMTYAAAARRLGLKEYHVRDDVDWLRREGFLERPPRPPALTKTPPAPPSVPSVPGFTIAAVQRLTVCVIRCPKCATPIQIGPDKLR